MAQAHRLPELPYPLNALEPHLSERTLSYHYGKHHAAYVEKLNKAVEGTGFEDKTLEETVATADGAMFNNAAQAWNHAFYWQCLSPNGGGDPAESLSEAIRRNFGSLDEFRKRFTEAATSLFGSGWTWLVANPDGTLEIVNTGNADTPVRRGQTPLLTCDVWEHAYYLDYQNARPDYLRAFWNLVNWDFVSEKLAAAVAAR
jgi:Fe-Mn family superoxide dismutase